MDIKGAEGMSPHDLAAEVQRGARVIEFSWCVSLLVVTFRRGSFVLVRPGESALSKGLPYTLLSLVAGWWGFPFGLIFTPLAVIQNLAGGRDVTAATVGALPPPQPQAQRVVQVAAPDGRVFQALLLEHRDGYCHVRLADGAQHWVPGTSVRG